MRRAGNRSEGLGGASLMSLRVLNSHSVRLGAEGAEVGAVGRWVKPRDGAGSGLRAGADMHGVGDGGGESDEKKCKDSFGL